MNRIDFLELVAQFIPYGATVEHHLVFADYLEDLGEMNLSRSMIRHSRNSPGYTRQWLERDSDYNNNIEFCFKE